MGLIMADTGYDAFKGLGNFKGKPLPLRTLSVLYPNLMHVVTLEGKGIKKVADLKGKRVSTGSPGSGTEVKARRVLEAGGIDPDKDIKKDRLGPASGSALADARSTPISGTAAYRRPLSLTFPHRRESRWSSSDTRTLSRR